MIRIRSIIAVACVAIIQWSATASAEETIQTQTAIVPPRLLENVEPIYPESERSARNSATVELTLTLDVEGRVSAAEVTHSASASFDQAALDAARRLVFAPATRDGVAIPAKIPFSFSFAIAAPPEAKPPTSAPPVVPRTASRPTQEAAKPPSSDEVLDIEVEGERPPREPTRRLLSGEEIQKLPGTNGDALRSIGNMPGVARPAGLDGLLIVRGSGPRDTQVFIDGTNIPLVYHFEGLSSVLPSEMLQQIDFYPGNYGPEYGRGMGGVIDVEVRSPKRDRLHGLLQLDLIDGRAMAEGPITDSTRFLVGSRRSWMDAWLGSVMRSEGLGVSTAPVYYDYQALVEHDLTRDTTVRLFAFGSDDRMELTLPSPDAADPALGGDFDNHTRFYRVQGSIDTRPTSKLRWKTTLAFGEDGEKVGIGNIQVDTRIQRFDGRSELRAQFNEALTGVVGVDVLMASYDVGWRLPAIDIDSDSDPGPLYGRPMSELDGRGTIVRPATYAQLELTPLSGLKLLPSLRMDYSEDTGEVDFDPRLAARYELFPGDHAITLKAGVGVYHQAPEPYQSIRPFGNPGVESNRSIHYSFGVEQKLSRALELSVEGFYKDLSHLVVATSAGEKTESGIEYKNVGAGRVVGSEMLLRYQSEGPFFGWLAYTLSRSERRDASDQAWYRFQYDQTHILAALGSVKLGAGYQLGARFRYVTGSLYTPNVGGVMDYDAGVYAPVASAAHNSARMPAFHQLDVRFDKTWDFKSWKLSAYLDLQNAYNHKNVEGISYNYDYSKTSTVSGLPLLPVIGVRGEL